jgi:thioesterase domain-containing protein
MLIAELTAQIRAKVPDGPIRILGDSIGGHFGYAAAISLERSGREVAGFCAIDSFMITSASRRAGWKGRASARAWELLAARHPREFVHFGRSLCWRSLLRLTARLWPALLRRHSASGRLPWWLSLDSMFEHELSMRLLIRAAGPWIGMMDQRPASLNARSVLLRTQANAGYDAACRRRCPNIEIMQVRGQHHSVLNPDNISVLRQALLTAFAQDHGRLCCRKCSRLRASWPAASPTSKGGKRTLARSGVKKGAWRLNNVAGMGKSFR